MFWIVSGGCMFLFFWWLFSFAVPGAEIEFALGLTVILLSGLLTGRYLSRIWYKTDRDRQNTLLWILTALLITGFFMIGWLVNRMIGETEFIHFFFTILILFFVSVVAAVIISLLRNRIKSSLADTRSALSQSRMELQVIQSQLSPHFLFNTLNNMYGLSLAEPGKIPKLILKLSDLLRYSVYETKELFVPLKDEVDYINNYIEFEKIRLGNRLDLKVALDNTTSADFPIAPMLLIVFVENAFKHSKNNEDAKIHIDIKLILGNNIITFSVINSYSDIDAVSDNRNSGFGLDSVRKRLNLLYNNKHDLKITASGNIYSVTLTLYNQ
jgi:LytS/YehU family sensor histidine kinase